MNVIFGSGVIGLLAKRILPSWKVIPFSRSRFFSWNPPLDDNFIIQDGELDAFIKDLTGTVGQLPIFPYKRRWSISGQLYKEYDAAICNDWLSKLFGSNIPGQVPLYMKNRLDLSVYDIRVNQVYNDLVNEYLVELRAEAALGEVTEIGNHYFMRGGIRNEFDNAISTIPLDTLLQLTKLRNDLESKPIHYMHVSTEDLDFEGANQVLVVDPSIAFFKVSNIAPQRYLFYFHDDVEHYGVYFRQFMHRFDILDGTSLDKAIPLGQTPKLSELEDNYGIFAVGSYAQWDWCMDVGSCIMRLLRYSSRGWKPGKMRPL